jgi:hypothetical protein
VVRGRLLLFLDQEVDLARVSKREFFFRTYGFKDLHLKAKVLGTHT